MRLLLLPHHTPPIPPPMIPGLKVLHLYRNGLTGRLPTSLRWLGQLEELRLWGNALEGPIPPEYGELERLKVLQLSDNRLQGRSVRASMSQSINQSIAPSFVRHYFVVVGSLVRSSY